MNWFWQKQTPPKAMVRRVEITVEEHWVSGVVPSAAANDGQAPPDREQRIVRSPELPPGTEGNRGVTEGNHGRK
jgi:hypothetical protein